MNKNDLIEKMNELGYEYDNEVAGILFINVEDGSDLLLNDWNAVESYVNEQI